MRITFRPGGFTKFLCIPCLRIGDRKAPPYYPRREIDHALPSIVRSNSGTMGVCPWCLPLLPCNLGPLDTQLEILFHPDTKIGVAVLTALCAILAGHEITIDYTV